MSTRRLRVLADMRRFLEAQALALAQVVGEKAGERAVAHYHLHLPQQRLLRGHRVPKGDGRRCVRLAGWYHPAGQYVAQRIDEH